MPEAYGRGGKHGQPIRSPSRTARRGGGNPLLGPRKEGYVEVSGEMYRALIDSSSQITSITYEFWHKHPELCHQKLQPSNIRAEGADGQDIPHHGVLLMRLKVLGKEYACVPAFVAPETEYRSMVPLLVWTNVT